MLSRWLLNPFQKDNMREVQLGAHTVQSHGVKLAKTHMHDWFILIFLVVLVVILNAIPPFHRFVGKDMMTDLKYPLKSNTVPVWAVPLITVLLPIAIFAGFYFRRRDVYDLHHAVLGVLFSVLIAGVMTHAIKDAVGRPRPDFFWRCFPQGKEVQFPRYAYPSMMISLLIFCPLIVYSPLLIIIYCLTLIKMYDQVTGNVICNGDKSVIKEGYKSFPSGHSTWAFAGLSFLALYLSGKIKVFDRKGHVAKLCIVFLPLLVASLIGISRVDDYWHHWQDVFAGGLIGSVVATICYLQFFPPPYHTDGWGPYAYFHMLEETRALANPALLVDQQAEGSSSTIGLSGNTILDELESGRM